MPAFPNLTATETGDLIRFLRTLRPRDGSGPVRTTRRRSPTAALSKAWSSIRARIDLQLLGDDRKIHLLRKSGDRYRAVTSQADWPSYNGQTTGSRYSPLAQITKGNVARLAPKWIFSLPNTSRLQVTPVVVDGVMYVTSANECYALDAGTGREIWHYQRPRTKGLVGNAAGGINRGVGVAGDRVFMVTDHAHVIALNRFTGALLWETEMADWRQNYNATGAPLSSATSSSPARPAATKACAASSPPSIRPPARKSGASGPCRARRTGVRDLAGQRHRAPGRDDLADRHLRSRARHGLLADRQSRRPI